MGKVIPLRRGPLAVVPPRSSPEPPPLELDILPIAALLFAASLARVACTLRQHRYFDAEASLALLCVVALPWLAWPSRRKSG